MSIFAVKTASRCFCFLLILGCASLASASATLLLEEPYGKMGFFTATGHAAVYLSDVCADSPTVLRPCARGETGIVLSRYDGVGGYDWLAIPLIPYLYAVNNADDVPLFADAKMVAVLRDQYRREYLEKLVPDTVSGRVPSGNWYQLVGSSYDRTIYGFEFNTTREQDDALIRELNSSPNVSHFHLASNNCADFAKAVLNFYFPKSFHRSLIADVGITTPKQIAKMLTKFAARHRELELSRFVIAQVPGTMPRSTAVHGVVESFLKSKKYIVPSVFVSPVFAGCVFAVYVGTGAGRFEPDRDALTFAPGDSLETPLSRAERKAYLRQLQSFITETEATPKSVNVGKEWAKLESKAQTELDEDGSPALALRFGKRTIPMGIAEANFLKDGVSPELARTMIEARLESQLRRAPVRGLSQSEVTRDWNLLQEAQRRTLEVDSRHPVSPSLALLPVALTGTR